MAQIPPLKTLCYGKITKHIWLNNFSIDVLVDYVYHMKITSSNKPWLEPMSKRYHTEIEDITDKVMQLDKLPKAIRLRLCIAIIHFNTHVTSWCEEALSILEDKRRENLFYILKKTIFTETGQVNRSYTILKCLFDSYRRLELNHYKIAEYCDINHQTVINYVKRSKYIKNKQLIDYVCRKITLKDVKAVWSKRYNYSLSSSQLTIEGALHGTLEVFEYFYNMIKADQKVAWLCKVLVYLFKSDKGFLTNLKIIYIYQTIDDMLWKKMLNLYGAKFPSTFFISEHNDYCVHFYKQVCLYAPQHCHEILGTIFLQLSCNYFEYCHIIFQEVGKETFMRLWCITPAGIKNSFVEKEEYNFLGRIEDYELVSLILKDPELTEENRTHLVNYLILYYKCDNESISCRLELLQRDFNMKDVFISTETIKKISTRHFSNFSLNIESGIFKSESDLLALKNAVINDEKYIIEVIQSFQNSLSDPMVETETFLGWCFSNKEDKIKFLSEVLIHEKVFIDLYQLHIQYIKLDADDNVEGETNFMKDLFANESALSEIKKMISTTEFVRKNLELLIGSEPEEIRYAFNELLTKPEKRKEVKTYLLSENGLKDILKTFIHSDLCDSHFVHKYEIGERFKSYLDFEKYWVRPFRLNDRLFDYMLLNSSKVYKKHFKAPKVKNMLPHESLKQYRTIVNSKFEIFTVVISGNIPRRLPGFDVMEFTSLPHLSDCLELMAGLDTSIPKLIR